YGAIKMTGMPDIYTLHNISKIHLLTSSFFFPGGDTTKDISQEVINTNVPPQLNTDTQRPVVLDIEIARYTDIAQDTEQHWLRQAMAWTRASVPYAITAGMYTLEMPQRTFFGNDTPEELAAWQAHNDATAAKILSSLDFLNVSIYTFYSPDHVD